MERDSPSDHARSHDPESEEARAVSSPSHHDKFPSHDRFAVNDLPSVRDPDTSPFPNTEVVDDISPPFGASTKEYGASVPDGVEAVRG